MTKFIISSLGDLVIGLNRIESKVEIGLDFDEETQIEIQKCLQRCFTDIHGLPVFVRATDEFWPEVEIGKDENQKVFAVVNNKLVLFDFGIEYGEAEFEVRLYIGAKRITIGTWRIVNDNIYNNDYERLQLNINNNHLTDIETKAIIKSVWEKIGPDELMGY